MIKTLADAEKWLKDNFKINLELRSMLWDKGYDIFIRFYNNEFLITGTKDNIWKSKLTLEEAAQIIYSNRKDINSINNAVYEVTVDLI